MIPHLLVILSIYKRASNLPGPPWQILDSTGAMFVCTNSVKDSSGATYVVSGQVLDSAGNVYNAI